MRVAFLVPRWTEARTGNAVTAERWARLLSELGHESDAVPVCEADLVVALGSTLSVYPAANIPLTAAERGVPYVIINQGETDHDRLPGVTLRLEGDVQELFPPSVTKALGDRPGA